MRSLIFALALGVICGASAGEGPRSAATQSMWDALLAGDHDAVVQAIGQGADLDSRGERGDTPLHLVVRRAHALDEIRFLLDRGADPNAVNQWRQTPLMVALFADTYEANPTTVRHRTEVASLLLERGASPRDPNVPAQNLLDRPLERGEGRLVLRLLEAGATLPEDALMRAMLPASIARDPDLLRLVIERSAPAQFRYQDERGFTPAHRALWGEAAFPVLEACIAAGVSPNVTADGQWALVHEAAWVGNLLAIEWLVARGARLDARTEDGRTALHVAAGVPNPRTMEWLLAKGLDPGQVDAAGRRPLDHFVRSRLYRLEPARAVALSQALGGTEADVRSRAQHPDHAMFEAIWRNDLKAVKARIDEGGNVNSVDGNGSTPLSRALRLSRGQLVTAAEQSFGKRLLALLMANGADETLWIPAEDKTHLEFAREIGMEKELERLIRRRR